MYECLLQWRVCYNCSLFYVYLCFCFYRDRMLSFLDPDQHSQVLLPALRSARRRARPPPAGGLAVAQCGAARRGAAAASAPGQQRRRSTRHTPGEGVGVTPEPDVTSNHETLPYQQLNSPRHSPSALHHRGYRLYVSEHITIITKIVNVAQQLGL